MKIAKISESGYEEAALGFSLSYNTSIDRAKELLPRFAFGIPGENKFLESIVIWMDVTAPRYWWQEADTYRMSTKQSESTMHTLTKKPLDRTNFEYPISENYLRYLNAFRLDVLNKKYELVNFKNDLPEGFLQRRIWMFSYKTLQNIYTQRHMHKLLQWRYFCDQILRQIDHPEFIVKEIIETN